MTARTNIRRSLQVTFKNPVLTSQKTHGGACKITNIWSAGRHQDQDLRDGTMADAWEYILSTKCTVFSVKECGRYSYHMVQDLKLSHTANVSKALLTTVMTRWNGFKAFWKLSPLPSAWGTGGTRWRGCLRNCATSRKVAGSIHDGVTGGPGVESVSKIE
jgi:hypothetical protein